MTENVTRTESLQKYKQRALSLYILFKITVSRIDKSVDKNFEDLNH